MSSLILLQSTAASVTAYLELTAGGPATGLIFSDLTADLKKEGQGSFTSFTLTGSNFTETGGGAYEIDLTTTDTDTLGNLYLRLAGATIQTTLVTAFIAATAPVNPPAPLTVPTTAMFGYIVGPQGDPVVGASVSARLLAIPSVGTVGNEGFVQDTSIVTAKSDSDGFFTIILVTGAQVDFFVPAADFRRTFQVPATSSNVFDLP